MESILLARANSSAPADHGDEKRVDAAIGLGLLGWRDCVIENEGSFTRRREGDKIGVEKQRR